MSRTLSPIRDLADFYTRRLNKISGHLETSQNMSKSPNRHLANKNNTSTFVDMDSMTAKDVRELEKNPPSIDPRRKNMKVVNNKAMQQFGT